MLKNELAMRDQSINRLLWPFSLPAIAGMLVSAPYNIVDMKIPYDNSEKNLW